MFSRYAIFSALFAATSAWGQSPGGNRESTEAVGSTGVVRDSKLPDWVILHEPGIEAKVPADDSATEVYHLLADRQLHAEEHSRHCHYAYRLLSEAGVQNNAQLTFDFDPEFQTLTFHRLRIHRKGEVIDRLATQEIQVLQRETGAERQLYDGRLSAVLLMEDVRVGDVIDYAYTIQGANPVFEGLFSDYELTRWSSPLEEVWLRVLWSADRPVRMRKEGAGPAPKISEKNGLKSAVLHETQVKAILSDGEVPGFFTTHPWVEFSEYPDWEAVARWAASQYSDAGELPAELETLLAELRVLPTDEARILGALKWVQDEIRYVGLFDGIHSHRPHPMDVVCRRRFGDCKNKSVILTRLLTELGFDAKLALVGTGARQAVADWLPSPGCFDHVVVCLEHGGRRHWLDGTRSYQRGPLNDLYFPDYGFALIISERTTDLTPIEPSGFEASRMEVTETIDMADYSGAGRLTVVSTFYGSQADSMRSYLASASRDNVEKDYLNHYSKDFPGIEIDRRLETEDREDINELVTREYYRLSNLWIDDKANPGSMTFETWARLTSGELMKPSTRIRTMPYAISHPRNVVHRMVLNFPTALPLVPDFNRIDDPAFEFSLRESGEGKRLELAYKYNSLASHVPAKAIGTYVKNVEAVEDLLGYIVTVPSTYRTMTPAEIEEAKQKAAEEPPFRPVWSLILVGVMAFVLGLAACVVLYFWDPTPRAEPGGFHAGLRGLGGWLVLVGFGILVRPCVRMATIVSEIFDWDAETWASVTQATSEQFDPLWEPAAIINFASLCALLPLEILLAVLFFKKRTSLPWLLSVYFALVFVASSGVTLMFSAISTMDQDFVKESYGDVGKVFVGALVWIPYLFLSKRVALTFVRRRRLPPVAAMPPPLPPQG